MFKRQIDSFLADWKVQPNRKPLVVRGARQVGKTTTIKQFGNKFDLFIYLNLELLADRRIFSQGLAVKEVVQQILLQKNVTWGPEQSCLFFIDEIQNSPEAVNLLRYFYEDYPNIHVIAAGSLLETLIETHISFPVGRVEYTYLYPLTFEEFLQALNEDVAFNTLQTVPFPEYGHEKLLDLFHLYSMVGGMPEIVAAYIKNRDWIQLANIYESLLMGYQNDVEKYATNKHQAQVISYVIDHAPLHAGSRIKFQNFGQSNYGSREVGEAMRVLEKALLLQLIYPTTAVKPPYETNYKKSPRLQFLDTGIVNFAVGLQREYFALKDLNNLYQGRITECIVGQQLIGNKIVPQKQLLFWVREKADSAAEVDFVIPRGTKLVPIEIKSGKTGTLRSLHSFISTSDQDFAIRIYSDKIYREKLITPTGKPFELLNLPYYLSGQLQHYLPP